MMFKLICSDRNMEKLKTAAADMSLDSYHIETVFGTSTTTTALLANALNVDVAQIYRANSVINEEDESIIHRT